MNWTLADRAVVDAICSLHTHSNKPLLIGLAGAQGSGKSTMARRLKPKLEAQDLRTAVLALDDFYLPREDRLALAQEIHPLLETRGVPGTHNVILLDDVIDQLLSGEHPVEVPQFDKASDERTDPALIEGPVDIVLLEGWCIGASAVGSGALELPINDLERTEDADAIWRNWVNRRLETDYATLFRRIDLRIFLCAPDFSVVAGWRTEQESDLTVPSMNPAQLARFVAHFERITRAMLDSDWADLVIELDAKRVPVALRQ
ncbi:MAG: kinase [Erythrobacter sp.]